MENYLPIPGGQCPATLSTSDAATEPDDWQYLTEVQRNYHQDRVRHWLASGDDALAKVYVISIQALAVDTLVRAAYRASAALQSDVSNSAERKGRPGQEPLNSNRTSAATLAKRFQRDLSDLLRREERRAVQELMRTTVEWWYENESRGQDHDLHRLIERCGDQLAALIVFSGLDLATTGLHETCWYLLARRVVEHILLPKVARDRVLEETAGSYSESSAASGPRPLTAGEKEDWINSHIGAILEKASEFRFTGIKPAITYFARACLLWELQQPFQVKTTALPTSELDLSAFEATFHVPSAEEQWIHTQELLTSELDAARPRLWRVTMAALSEEEAWRFWVLFNLRYYGREWNEIANLVLQPRCKILDPSDLPPGVGETDQEEAFARITALFQQMVKSPRNKLGKLTAATLRQRYKRYLKTLAIYLPAMSRTSL